MLMAVRVVSLPATARRMKNGAISWGASMSSPRVLLTSAEVRSLRGCWRRSSASSFMMVTSWTPAPIRASPMSRPCSISGSPAPRMTLVASSTVSNSLRGMPIMSQMMRSGNGREIASTRSTSPFSHISSITSVQTVSTESSTACSSRGAKERPTMPRWRAWRGLSMAMNDPKNSMVSAGMSKMLTEPLPEQKSCGRLADLEDVGVPGRRVEGELLVEDRVLHGRLEERCLRAQLCEGGHPGPERQSPELGVDERQALRAHCGSPRPGTATEALRDSTAPHPGPHPARFRTPSLRAPRPSARPAPR